MLQLHCHSNRQSDIGYYIMFLRCFPVSLGIPHVFTLSTIKLREGFSVISNSNLAVTTHITINYSRVIFFLKWFFKLKQVVPCTRTSRITFSLQYGKSLSIAPCSFVPKSSEFYLCQRKVNSFRNHEIKVLVDK